MFELAFSSDLFARSAAVAMIMLAFVAILIVPYLWSNYRSQKEAQR
jgi:hypothetical protein